MVSRIDKKPESKAQIRKRLRNEAKYLLSQNFKLQDEASIWNDDGIINWKEGLNDLSFRADETVQKMLSWVNSEYFFESNQSDAETLVFTEKRTGTKINLPVHPTQDMLSKVDAENISGLEFAYYAGGPLVVFKAMTEINFAQIFEKVWGALPSGSVN